MDGGDNNILNVLEDGDVSFSDLDDSMADPDFRLDSDFILESFNNLSDNDFYLKKMMIYLTVIICVVFYV